MKRFLSLIAAGALCLSANALTITQTQGWFESGCVQWKPVTGATDYNVYVSPSTNESWTKLDKELVRQYPSYYRADAVGLKAGDYMFKVEAVKGSSVMSGETATSNPFTATAHDRSGFAHVGMPGGVGAYKNDGTLKDGAKVLYVWADNAKTVSTNVAGATSNPCVGLQTILDAYQKGQDVTPLDIRIIGTVKAGDLDKMSSSAEGLQIKGKSAYSEMPITVEGIGDDAAISGFGILIRNCKGTEFRNFAIMLCMDDCLSLDTENSNVWIHNMDFFYGNTGGDADQAKGDGTVDLKGKTKNVTVSYNHFYDSGKSSLGGMKPEISSTMHTYHHNWFDHSDSRHPRIRTQFFHIYNNYYDGVSKYGVGATSGEKTDNDNKIGGSALVEANYFRNTKYPFLISKQGTDAEGEGTFSGEPGGVIKAYNNTIINARRVKYNTGSMTTYNWDAVLVTDRTAEVTAKCLSGYEYNNAADLLARTSYIENKMDAPEDVPAVVTGALGAGRMNHGDFIWEFDNSEQDENYKVVSDLKESMTDYKSTLVGLADGTKISNGGATTYFVGGDGVGKSDEENDSYVPLWGNGQIVTDVEGGSTPDPDDTGDDSEDAAEPEIVIGTDGDYFWINEQNATQVNGYIASSVITMDEASGFKPTVTVKDSSGKVCSDKTGSLQLNKETGNAIFYNEDGIARMDFYLARTGSMSGSILGSNDGAEFTEIKTYSASKGIAEISVASNENYKYYKITNTATGSLHIQGIRLYQPVVESDDLQPADLTKVNEITIALNLVGENTTYTLVPTTDYTTSSTGEITYASSNAKVATVSAEGVITAVGAGSANITLTQAADDTYKTGKITFAVTVTDNRAASALKLTSDAAVTLKMGESESSQIAIEGAAGAVTYKSSNPSVATVSDAGLITAKGAGEATITISDAGSETVKPGTPLSVKVTVEAADEEGGDEGDEGDDEDDPTSTEKVICHFLENTPSSDMVKFTGNYSNTKGTISYDGTDYGICAKIETGTEIPITPTFDCTITFIFDSASKRLKIDGTTYTTNANKEYSFEATAGTTYTFAKGDAMCLFLVIFTPKSVQGDVDGNGKVEQADAELLVKILLEQEKATEGANVDGSEDKDINVADLTKLIEILKKEEVTFPQPKDDDDVEFD